MSPFQKISLRNKIISVFPFLPKLAAMKRACSALKSWERDGWMNPPPSFVRMAMLESAAQAEGAECFIETGTFRGDTIWRFRKRFRKIITIEVQEDLATIARKRFAGYSHIEVVHGDSSQVLAKTCESVDSPCLIYLDGHYSAGFTSFGKEECPVLEELRILFEHLNHRFRIVIDDAREFGTDPAYPSIPEIAKFLESQQGDWQINVENDAIVIWEN